MDTIVANEERSEKDTGRMIIAALILVKRNIEKEKPKEARKGNE